MGTREGYCLLSDSPKEFVRKMERTWSVFVTEGTLPQDPGVRPAVAASWQRCRQSGVNPFLKQAPVTELPESHARDDAIRLALQLAEGLDARLRETRHILAVCSGTGHILKVVGDPQVRRLAENLHFMQGGIWTEGSAGTNAIGTAIASGKPVQVYATEHFCQGWHEWTCSAAPVRDPCSSQVLAVLDITGYKSPPHPDTLNFVTQLALRVESQVHNKDMFRRLVLMEACLRARDRFPNDGVAAFTVDARFVWANEVAHSVLPTLRTALPKQVQSLVMRSVEQGCDLEEEVCGHGLHVRVYCSPVRHRSEVVGCVLVLRSSSPVRSASIAVARSRPPVTFEHWDGAPTFSALMCEALRVATVAATSDVPVLILGETGTGKELVARTIHQSSGRRTSPFVAVNCGAIPRELVSAEFFGYEEGAFTGARRGGRAGFFEQADGGTLFLDEIGDLSPEAQVAILRVLETGEILRVGGRKVQRVDVRLIAATNKDLKQAVAKGTFREDLYYRLNTIVISLPPLRDRCEDIPLLVEHFLKKFGKPNLQFTSRAIQQLKAYNWPGNVRELQNVVRRIAILHPVPVVDLEDLPPEVRGVSVSSVASDFPKTEDAKRALIEKVVAETGGNVSEAARRLGIHRSTIYRHRARTRFH